MDTVQIVLCCFIALMLVPFVLLALNQLGFCRKLSCRVGWHSPSRLWLPGRFDGCSQHVTCPWCKYEGMVDSQGNLF